MFIMRQKKVLNLKMGGACNLKCPHCHSHKVSYKLHPNLFDWIEKQNFERITFSGGEPLLYFNFIRLAVEKLNSIKEYSIVTNGTLLTKEMVDFFNSHNFYIAISYDGVDSQRDNSIQPRWDLISQLNGIGLSTCVYPGNLDFIKIALSIDDLRQKHNLPYPRLGIESNFEFVHETDQSSNYVHIKSEDVGAYISQLQEQITFFMDEYAKGAYLPEMFVFLRSLKKWWMPKQYDGFRCCNNMAHSLTLDGRIPLCPYGVNFVADIDHKIDFKKIEKRYISKKCKACGIFHICKNTCIANVTNNECTISREMYNFFEKTIDKLNIREKLKKDLYEIYKLKV